MHARRGLAADDDQVLDRGTHAPGQLAKVEAAEDGGHEEGARSRLGGDEAHLALAIDRQDRVAHRTDGVDGDGERRPFPPAR